MSRRRTWFHDVLACAYHSRAPCRAYTMMPRLDHHHHGDIIIRMMFGVSARHTYTMTSLDKMLERLTAMKAPYNKSETKVEHRDFKIRAPLANVAYDDTMAESQAECVSAWPAVSQTHSAET